MNYNRNTSFKDLIYDTERKYQWHVDRLLREKSVSKRNKELFFDFVQSCLAQGITKERIVIYLRWLRVLGEQTRKPFDKSMAKREMQRVFAGVLEKRNYAPHSIYTIKAMVRKYFRWVYDLASSDNLPDVVRWIPGGSPPPTIRKDDLVVPEEVQKIISATPNVQYKAMIATHFWGALRPGELLTMRIGSVSFNSTEAMITVSGKMEKKVWSRQIPVYEPYDMLRNWLENHPFRHSQDHPLWITTRTGAYRNDYSSGTYHPGKPLTARFYGFLLKRIAENARLKKPVWPYLLRHSRGRMLYLELGEALAKKYMGHAPDSKMAKFYSHLIDEDLVNTMRRNRGIIGEETSQVNKNCPRCQHPNNSSSVLCSRCGFGLDVSSGITVHAKNEEAKEQMDTMKRFMEFLENTPTLKKVIENPELVDKFIQQEAKKRAHDQFRGRQKAA